MRQSGLEPDPESYELSAPPLSYKRELVSVAGFEPAAPCARGRCSGHTELYTDGDPWENRTPVLASTVRCPAIERKGHGASGMILTSTEQLLKLLPLPLGYRRELVDHRGFEPRSHGLRVRRSAIDASGLWWATRDLNSDLMD